MMIFQELDQKEISAYIVDGPQGRGILILPWSKNSRNESNPMVGYDQGTITDFDNNKYLPLVHFHTHPDNEYHPSDDDIASAKFLGIPSLIITDSYYTLINTGLSPIQHEVTGDSRYIIKGYSRDSLFQFIK